MREFFATPHCCLSGEFCRKVFDMFDSPKQLLDDTTFMAGLRGWADQYKVCNMHLERLLSQVRQAMGSSDRAPQAERVCAAGFLAQVLRDHLAKDGRDPRYDDRAHLLRDGVPLAAARRDASKSKPASGFIMYKSEQQHIRKETIGVLSRQAHGLSSQAKP